MPTLILETLIEAPPEICFDLMRDVRIHRQTTAQTNEKPVADVTAARIGLGQTVTFEGTHFGIRQRLTIRVVEFDRPRRFVDAMTEGRFKSFVHIHEFEPRDGGTLMRDMLIWDSPFGILGEIADRLLVEGHLTRLVSTRNSRLKNIAETEPA